MEIIFLLRAVRGPGRGRHGHAVSDVPGDADGKRFDFTHVALLVVVDLVFFVVVHQEVGSGATFHKGVEVQAD